MKLPTAREEEVLSRQLRAGEELAADGFAERYRPMLLAVIQQDCAVPSRDAEDVLQDVYRRFVPHIARVEHPRAFLRRIAERACIDYHQRRIQALRALEGFAREQSVRRRTPAEAEAGLIRDLDLARVIALSKGRCVDLFTKISLQGRTHDEYAQQTGTPRGTIGTTLARCLEKVRRLVAESREDHGAA